MKGIPHTATHTMRGGKTRGYASVAIGIATVMFLGFAPTYWVPLFAGRIALPALVHVHAALFFGWAILFVAQASLIARRQVSLHRRVGLFGVAWSIATILVGFRAAVFVIARDIETIDGTATAVFTIIPLTQIMMFSVCIVFGVVNIRNREVHKRFMMLAALVALTPALARIGLLLFGLDAAILPPFMLALTTAVLVGVIWWDAKRSGRLHPVYLWGGLLIVFVRIVRVPLALSDAWRSAAETIAGLVS